MPHRRCLTSPPPSPPAHDYELEPPDEVIAELQSTVVQSRQRGRSRDELLGELAIATRDLGDGAEAQVFMEIAALAVLLRMAGAA